MHTSARIGRTWAAALAVSLVAIVPATASAVRPDVNSRSPALQPARDLGRQEVAGFADAYFAEKMAESHMPGAALVVVKDGAILLAKGYGVSDLEAETPVDAATTIFHTASVSKLFTASAVMQLVEQGQIALDADVNTYLEGFQVPATFPEPVTIAHLLTHTAGWDEAVVGLGARSEVERIPLADFVKDRMPRRVRPPGEVYSYSNYGFALLGHVVEGVSGLPFVQYMQDRVLQPLGMRRSGFTLAPELAPDVATGYRYEGGRHVALAFPYVNTTPASELTAPSSDMAAFMIAHLQDGAYGTARLMDAATAQEMHRQHFSHHPLLPGIAYAFHESPGVERFGLGHSGAVDGFGSALYLLPEDELGLYLASNLDGSEEILTGFADAFLAAFYPRPAPAPVVPIPADADHPTAQLAGTYRRVRQSQRTFDKAGTLLGVFGPDVRVAANPDGTLRVRDADWARIEPLAFRQVDGEDVLAFREDGKGGIAYLFVGGTAFFRTKWYDTPPVGMAVAGFALCVFLVTAIGWPLSAYLRRRRRMAMPASANEPSAVAETDTAATGVAETRARRLAWILCVLNLLFFAGLVLALSEPASLLYGASPLLYAVLGLGIVTAILTIPVALLAGLAWWRGYWSVAGRAYYTLVALAALGFVWFLNQWNLLGYRL